jgi:hypothetical protein
MNPSSWWTLKIIFGGTAAVFGLLAACCTFVDVVMGKNQKGIKTWFRRRWEGVESNRWRDFPEGVIGKLLAFKRNLRRYIDRVAKASDVFDMVVVKSSPLIVGVVWFFFWGIGPAVGGFLLCILCIVLIFFVKSLPDKFYGAIGIAFFGCMISVPFLILWYALGASIFYASAVMILLLPILGTYFAFFFLLFLRETWISDIIGEQNLLALAFALAVSFTLTFVAFLAGHLSEPDAWIPQTLRMLISNVVFDGATFMATIWFITWAIRDRPLVRIPIAIAADIALGAVFACLSLYIGLAETEHSLSLGEILNVLIAKSPDGTAFEIGPYFWAMHTAFLPTIAYLSIIIIGWMGKAMLVPVGWFFGAGQQHKNPLKLTAALLAIFVALFTVLAYGAGAAENYSKEQAATQQASESPD